MMAEFIAKLKTLKTEFEESEKLHKEKKLSDAEYKLKLLNIQAQIKQKEQQIKQIATPQEKEMRFKELQW